MEHSISNSTYVDNDVTAVSRKQDHIQLAFEAQVASAVLDERFYYEPFLAAHPTTGDDTTFEFLGKTMRAPLWVSSMTGGTEYASRINHNLARVAQEFGFGMGLGSCRGLLTSDEYLPDFDVRSVIGDDLPLYANLGIAQLEVLIEEKKLHLVTELVNKLQVDGLIVHVNPFQEWLQPEGDKFAHPPLDTIRRMIDAFPDMPFIVKEVGQGMGRRSLEALLQLPLAAIDFAANGGTNFAKLELLRSTVQKQQIYAQLVNVGHSATEMVEMTNALVAELGDRCQCQQIIVSGGVRDFLDGYYFTQKLQLPAIYGQASAFLKYARDDYEQLQAYTLTQIEGLRLANNFLAVK